MCHNDAWRSGAITNDSLRFRKIEIDFQNSWLVIDFFYIYLISMERDHLKFTKLPKNSVVKTR